MKYYRDVDTGNIVRKPEECMYLEYTFAGLNGWEKTNPDDSYEREYWLGQGNTCLFDISEKDALAIVASWKRQSPPSKTAVEQMADGTAEHGTEHLC